MTEQRQTNTPNTRLWRLAALPARLIVVIPSLWGKVARIAGRGVYLDDRATVNEHPKHSPVAARHLARAGSVPSGEKNSGVRETRIFVAIRFKEEV